jgi:DNA primase
MDVGKFKLDARPIEQIAESIGLDVKRRGRNYVGLCPFHNEKTPSFSISPSKQIYKCFGCGAHGDVIDLVQEHQGLEFVDAVRVVASLSGLDADQYIEKKQVDPAISHLKSGLSIWRDYFISHRDKVDQWLSDRGISPEEADQWGIGFAAHGYPSVEFAKAGYLRKVGLMGDQSFLFKDRITFPIRNRHGEVVSFAGRKWKGGGPKWINGTNSSVFNKSSILYGMDKALPLIRRSGEAILVEGYVDVIALHRAGLCNSVASCGTSFTEHHAREIKRSAQKVFLMLDPDDAGRKATIKTGDICIREGLEVFVVELKGGDPEDIVKKSRNVIFQFVEQATNYFQYAANQYIGAAESEEFLISVVRSAAMIENKMRQNLVIREIASNFGVQSRQLHKLLSDIKKREWETTFKIQ